MSQPPVATTTNTLPHSTTPPTHSAYETAGTANQAAHNTASSASQGARDTAATADRAARDTASSASQGVRDTAAAANQTARETASYASHGARETAASADRATRDVASSVDQKARNAAASANQTAHSTAQAAQNTAASAQAKLHNAADKVAHHPLVQSGTETVNQQLNILDRELAKFGFLNDMEARTKIPKTYGVLGLTTTLVLLILLNLFGLASPVTNLIGWVIPAYLSCQALESPGKNDDKQWLTYWIVFGLFNFLESSMLRLVLYYFPMYFTFKIVSIMWLVLPQTRGAEMVYDNLVRPAFRAGKSRANHLSSTGSSASFGSGTTTNTGYPSTATANPSTGFNPAGTTAYPGGGNDNPTIGYSSATNPFVATSAEGAGLTSRNVAGVQVPQAAGGPVTDSL